MGVIRMYKRIDKKLCLGCGEIINERDVCCCQGYVELYVKENIVNITKGGKQNGTKSIN